MPSLCESRGAVNPGTAGSQPASQPGSRADTGLTCVNKAWPVLMRCRELWYRASLAWQAMLRSEHLGKQGLVVGHNAVNQALICTALGLLPAHFRRFTQASI